MFLWLLLVVAAVQQQQQQQQFFFFFYLLKKRNKSVLALLFLFLKKIWGLDCGGSVCLSLLEDIPIVGRMIREKCFESETKTVRYSGASEEVVWRRGRQREFVY